MHSYLQRASQIRSVPFTGDSSDSDSDCGEAKSREDPYETNVFRGSFSRNTTTTTTTMTSSTSGDMSLPSPRGFQGPNHQLRMASSHFKHQNTMLLNTASATNRLGNDFFKMVHQKV